jgi:hypothetical protein
MDSMSEPQSVIGDALDPRPRCPRCHRQPLMRDREGDPYCISCGTIRIDPGPIDYRPEPKATKRERPLAPRANAAWTAQEDAFVLANLTRLTLRQLAARLGRTEAGVQTRLDLVLGIRKPYVKSPRQRRGGRHRQRWTSVEDAIASNGGRGAAERAGRTADAARARRRRIRLGHIGRTPSPEAPREGAPWAATDDAFVFANLAAMTYRELAEALGRTANAVVIHVTRALGVRKRM